MILPSTFLLNFVILFTAANGQQPAQQQQQANQLQQPAQPSVAVGPPQQSTTTAPPQILIATTSTTTTTTTTATPTILLQPSTSSAPTITPSTTTTTTTAPQAIALTSTLAPTQQASPSQTPNPTATLTPTTASPPANAKENGANQTIATVAVNPTGSSTASTTVQFLKPKSKFKCSNATECHNEGVCVNGTCFCSPGFTGESCATNIDECRQSEQPCLNNGTCIDQVNDYKCECPPGFRGDFCEESIDMCLGSPCFNQAKCINLRTDFICECEAGWEGKTCEKNIDECLAKPCQNNGTCFDLINDYRCECLASTGWTGKNCDVDFDDCAAKPCGFGAKECVDMTGDYRCICHDGWTGKKCDVDIDECLPNNPCENNATCTEKSINIEHHFSSANQHLNLSSFSIDHLNHDSLLNLTGTGSNLNLSMFAGFTCECKEEYYGDRCEERKKCYTKSVFELCNHQQAECVNAGSSYECLINASSDGSGMNFAYYRVNGEFKMREIYVKYRSYTGGILMSFETANSLDSPVADLQLNKSGLYLSGTPIKRDENIKFDELLDGQDREIRLGLDTPTEIKSITLTRQNSSTDYSAPHFSTPFKGCLIQVRLNNQLLPLIDYSSNLNTNSSSTFELVENRLDVGACRTCFEKDCLNSGRCELTEGFDHCSCPETFSGPYCENDVNECEKSFNICLNGGSCENFHGGHRCNCKEGYRGEY